MAPSIKRLRANDDFVLTISDNDEDAAGSAVSADDAAVDGGVSTSLPNDKKRKRNDPSRDRASSDLPTSTKKRRRAVKASTITNEGVGGLAAHHDASTADVTIQDADDVVLDPDFDFETGNDAALGSIEDIYVWDKADRQRQVGRQGDKKAVDIDEIIAKRRNKTNGNSKSLGTRPDESDENKQDDAVNGPETLDLKDDDDDELLAADGFGMGANMSESGDGGQDGEHGTGSSESNGSDGDDSADELSSGDDSMAPPVPHPDDALSVTSSMEQVDEAIEEKARKDAFFAPEDSTNNTDAKKQNSKTTSFQSMSLSRPVLKGLAAVGFSEPTPIQAKTIPMALLGKDIVGGAVTGSGKTAAFLVPILERLLYRSRKVPTSRVAILMPTRELAVQCYQVARKLATFTDMTFCRLVGGFSLREQEKELRMRPDVIIATPGRFIDHMRNSASFTVDTLEILVLDEADRMLEDGFADELNEILVTIPKSRQTMLFSATMTDSVDKLIRVGMTRPVRLLIDARKQTVGTLVQEFVRLRPGREGKRLGYLLLLCQDVYTERAIVFFRQKKEAHRVRVVFGLFGLKAAELHGNMSQEQRIASVEDFRDGKVSFLLATDLASRGLDIKGVETVINYEAPQSHEIYLHRVGRTARAGRTGRACTIAAEPDRKVVKAAVKAGRSQGAKIVSRVIDTDLADDRAQKVDDLEDEVEAILKEEKEEKQLAQAEMQVTRGSNMLTHEEEIMSRPKRTWFESEKQKSRAKAVGRAELNGIDATKGKKKGKLSGKDKKRMEDKEGRMTGKVWKKGKGDGEKAAVEKKGKGTGAKGEKVKGGKKARVKGKR
ncbi:MAG: nucleolar DEAD-box protein required for synthesis of 60S ribosomal subunit [Caeruleum heppii]|nr:MAG: nucleolar DEAD-box protein required for synthesis of 60S ribosomal subunit [Caeruleum heppii]